MKTRCGTEGRDLAANEQRYGRDVQRQGLDYSQGLATNDIEYRRMVEENQLREGRGLAESERNYRMDTTENETEQARRWQEYSAAIAEQDRIWGRYSTLAGYGQGERIRWHRPGPITAIT